MRAWARFRLRDALISRATRCFRFRAHRCEKHGRPSWQAAPSSSAFRFFVNVHVAQGVDASLPLRSD
eukprot:3341394-Pleurochrysis_carterae.AAC.1